MICGTESFKWRAQFSPSAIIATESQCQNHLCGKIDCEVSALMETTCRPSVKALAVCDEVSD